MCEKCSRKTLKKHSRWRFIWTEPTETLDTALELAGGMGRFHLLLVILCGLAYSSTSIVPSVLRFYASDIECELEMTMRDKVLLNDITYGGMLSGTVMWALLGDFCGRRISLVGCLLLNAAATVGLCLSQRVIVFGTFKFLCSASISGMSILSIVFLAEYSFPRYRGEAICFLQLFWVFGSVLMPTLGMPWRISMGLAALGSVLVAVRLLFLYETPRFLLSTGAVKTTLRSLAYMFEMNTGSHRSKYPVRSIRDNETVWELEQKEFPEYIPEYLRPKRYCIPIVMAISLVLFFSYHTMELWFESMICRFDFFWPVARYLLPAPANCELGDYAASPRQHPMLIHPEAGSSYKTVLKDPCIQAADVRKIRPYTNMLLAAVSCLPSALCITLSIDALGRIFFISISHVLAGCLVFSSFFLNYTPHDILFVCFFGAMCTMSVASCHCLALELSTTRWRCVAVGLVVGMGQVGATLGNLGLAVMITGTCVSLVSTLAFCIIATGMLSIALTDTSAASLR